MRMAMTLESPIGTLWIVEEDGAIVRIDNRAAFATRDADNGQSCTVLTEAIGQLKEYFAGERKDFTFPIRLDGTPFQKRVWEALRQIPYGETISYAALASAVGSSQAMRAVGNANGKNPVMIAVPCHRVIRKDGACGGYAGGVENKKILLDLEMRFQSYGKKGV